MNLKYKLIITIILLEKVSLKLDYDLEELETDDFVKPINV